MTDLAWSNFEMQTFLALIAKGVHVNGSGRKKFSSNLDSSRRNFAKTFNTILSGNEFQREFDEEDILEKLDELLVKRKHVVGRNGLVERSRATRITRSMTLAFRRTRGMDFNGSVAEWMEGRKKEVVTKFRKERGLAPLPDSAFEIKSSSKITFKGPVAVRRYEDCDPGNGDTAIAPDQYPRNKAAQVLSEKRKRLVRGSKTVDWGGESESDDNGAELRF